MIARESMPLQISERLKLRKEIATSLSFEEWYLIDLTLTEYGLPTEQTWNGEKSAYVLAMISGASEATLIDMAKHLGFVLPLTDSVSSVSRPLKEADQPAFWHKNMFKLFVSHLANQRKYAGDLRKHLLKFGISCFVAHDDISPTKEWQIEIEAGLRTCDSLVALLHEGFHVSQWTDQEIGFVMGRNLPAFAVRLGETPYGFIGRFQAFNGLGKTAQEVAKDLFDAYRQNPLTKSAMALVCVSLFEASDSFDQAKARIRYLEELDIWEESFSERITTAMKVNSQISGSYGVPARVKALLQSRVPETV